MDEIEQILALYESKLDLDDEFFENAPDMPVPEVNQPEVVARTENPLLNAMEPVASAPASRAKTEKKKVEAKGATAAAADVPKTYVPPPPPDGLKIPPPAGMPAVKTFPISSGPPPKGMSFPGVAEAPAPEGASGEGATPAEEGQDAAPGGEEEEIDDGFTPE